MAKSLPENVKVLKSLYEASEVINSIRDYNETPRKDYGYYFECTWGWERILMILEDKKGEMKVEVARNLHKENIINSKEISMTSVYKALQDGEIVLTSDAKTDPRFSQSTIYSTL